jgi:hypothetical protein
MACSALPLEIARNNLTPCVYLELHCLDHGKLRIAIRKVPVEKGHSCPLCGCLSWYAILGRGGTLRKLPFWNKLNEAFSIEEAIKAFWRSRQPRQMASSKVAAHG